ncbi:MAG TPA: response regulator [Planctomycetaceae bacterium]
MKTILLVDDSRAVRLAERRSLAALGVEVVEAGDGAEALALVRSGRRFDAVLLDWNMPVMDGLSFLRALRAEPLDPQPRVVMCTTESDMARIVEAVSAGADEYIMKPFTEEIVRSKLEQTGVL